MRRDRVRLIYIAIFQFHVSVYTVFYHKSLNAPFFKGNARRNTFFQQAIPKPIGIIAPIH